MTITTKLDPGSSIFFIHEKKVIESIVRGFTTRTLDDKTEVIYLCSKEGGSNLHIKVDEKDAYKTKELLLQSL